MEWMRLNVAMREAEKENLRAVVALTETDLNSRIVHHFALFAGRYSRAEAVSPTALTRVALL